MMTAQAESTVEVVRTDEAVRLVPCLPDVEARVCELYKGGLAILVVAREVGRSDTFVRSVLQRRGVAIRGRKRANVSVERIVALYEQGKSMVEIAELLGCSPPLINRRLEDAGVTKRSRSLATRRARRTRVRVKRIDLIDHDPIVQCYERVRSVERVAEELGEDKTLVSTVLKRRGFVLRQGGRAKHNITDEMVVSICLRREAGESWSSATYKSGVEMDAGRNAALRRGPALMAALRANNAQTLEVSNG